MIPRLRPSLDWRELAAALRPPRRDHVERFEAAFAREMGQKHAIAFPYGRTGLMLAIEALGLRQREILCPAYTCVVVPHAIVFSGNRPVFVDCREGEFNMDLDRAEEKIGERTGAIIATSLFGHPVDLDRLDALLRRHPQVAVLQDCAHSFAAEWKGRPVQRAGIAAVFGLNVSKIITSVFGGAVTTDDEAFARKLRGLRRERLGPASWAKGFRRLLYLLAVYPGLWPPTFRAVALLERAGWLDRFVKYYDPGEIDMPPDYLQSMSAIEARVGLVQLAKRRSIVAARRRVAAFWRRRLADESGLVLPPDDEGATYSHFVCRVEDREAWVRRWQNEGIQLGTIIDYSIPHLAAYRDVAAGDFPVALLYSRSTINFPLSPEVLHRSRAGSTAEPSRAGDAGRRGTLGAADR